MGVVVPITPRPKVLKNQPQQYKSRKPSNLLIIKIRRFFLEYNMNEQQIKLLCKLAI